jgi:hypothetical protein
MSDSVGTLFCLRQLTITPRPVEPFILFDIDAGYLTDNM